MPVVRYEKNIPGMLLFLVFVAEDAIEVKQKGPFNVHLQ